MTHPDVQAEFMAEQFFVQLGSLNPFPHIPVEQGHSDSWMNKRL